ncbi:MAG: glycosyl hydrolase family 28-related protein [Xanthobacteraceae bacterium]
MNITVTNNKGPRGRTGPRGDVTPEAEAARDAAQGYADIAASVTDVIDLPSRVLAEMADLPAARKVARLLGYAAAGAGGALYQRVAAEPTHSGKFRSTDRALPNGSTDNTNGGWWALAEERISVTMFGAVGDGVTDDTAAMQAAIDFCATVGIPVLSIPAGVWMCSGLVLKSGVTLKGEQRSGSILRKYGMGATPVVTTSSLAANNDIGIADLEVDGISIASIDQSLIHINYPGQRVTISGVTLRNGMNRWALRISGGAVPHTNLQVLGCQIVNCPQGGLIFLPTVKGSNGTDVLGCTFDGVGHNILSLHDVDTGNNDTRWDCNFNVRVNDNVIKNVLLTGENGPIPFEVWGATGYQCMRNMIDGGTRGLSGGGNAQDFEVAYNLVKEQTIYGCEAGQARRGTIHDNTFIRCKTGITYTGGNIEVSKVSIDRNTFIGTGALSYDSVNAPCIVDLKSSTNTVRDVAIRNNRILSPEYCRYAINAIGSDPSPSISFGGGGTGAEASATLKAVSGRIVSPGSGYTSAPTLSVVGGGGTGVTATAAVSGGKITGVTITGDGSGSTYTTDPEVIVSGGGGAGGQIEIRMGIDAVTVTNGGTGYSSPTVSISGNGGTGATATASQSGGVITAVAVSNAGAGFGRGSTIVVDDNEIYLDTVSSALIGISLGGAHVWCRGNKIIRSASFDATHYAAATEGMTLLRVPAVRSAANAPVFLIERNTLEMLGSNGGQAAIGIGRSASAAPMRGIIVRGNILRGNLTNWAYIADTSGDTILQGNDTSGTTNSANLDAALVYKDTVRRYSGAAAPTTGTWRRGDVVSNESPSAAGVPGWVCVTAGSPGTWRAMAALAA